MNDSVALKESHLRSILKAISYRIVGTIATWGIVFSMTGDARVSTSIAAIEPIVKTLVYYLHERAWQQLPRGTLRRVLGAR